LDEAVCCARGYCGCDLYRLTTVNEVAIPSKVTLALPVRFDPRI
jgi:hypothetical protein